MKAPKILLSLLVFCTLQGYAQTFTYQKVAGSISSPTAFAFVDKNLILVTEKTGKLRVIKNNTLLPKAAITLSVSTSSERGLIGVAVDPDFETNKYVYLYYTVPTPTIFNRIERYKYQGDTLTPSTKQTLLELNTLSAGNHNGGALNFGPDKKLYIGVGENAVGSNAQNLDNYLGKILRINADGTVPSDNPFTGNAAKSRIWAYGLRNPYTFTFDPLSGKLFINDVGENTWEEINYAPTGGLNFGWPAKEGFCTSNCTGLTNPVFAYGHGDGIGLGCSIIGGTFFNTTATNYPANLQGKYFYTDYCGDWINYIDPANPAKSTPFISNLPGGLTYLITGPDGNLYFLSRSDGALYKITYEPTTSITDIQFDASLKVYPNPALNTIKIEGAAQHAQISIFDHLGKKVYVGLNEESIDISHLKSGIYVITVDGKNVKLIKH